MDIEEQINNYSPSQEVIDLVESTPIVLFCGISAAGKDTLQNELLKEDKFTRIITSTTREPREENGVMEQNGREYHFFTEGEAIEKIKQREYFEVARVHTKINGVTASEIKRIHDEGRTAVGDVDYQGIDYFYRYAPTVKAIFIVPPNYAVWHKRMSDRYESEEKFLQALPARRESAIKELEWALTTDHCYMVINDDLQTAVGEIKAIIEGDMGKTDVAREVVLSILRELRDI